MSSERDEVTRNIIEIVGTATRCDLVDEESSQLTVAQWDSLAYMLIVSEVELKYDLNINQDNIGMFTSIHSIVGLVVDS